MGARWGGVMHGRVMHGCGLWPHTHHRGQHGDVAENELGLGSPGREAEHIAGFVGKHHLRSEPNREKESEKLKGKRETGK